MRGHLEGGSAEPERGCNVQSLHIESEGGWDGEAAWEEALMLGREVWFY